MFHIYVVVIEVAQTIAAKAMPNNSALATSITFKREEKHRNGRTV